jgi:hypothetical protein
MKSFPQLSIAFLLCIGRIAAGSVLYVDVNNSTPSFPYTNWAAAATSIQDAIDSASAGDQIFVTNGIYQTGGRVVYGLLTNRVAVNKAVAVQSVNGPAVTIISGNFLLGNSAVRCVYLTNGASLIGFTTTNGSTRTSGDVTREQSGAGIWCESTNASISNCWLIHNIANQNGGGVYRGTLSACVLTGNRASSTGGGAYSSLLNGCDVKTNSAGSSGGGAALSTMNDSTIFGNTAVDSGGGTYSGFSSSCLFLGNKSGFATVPGNGGGAYMGTLSNCTFIGNIAGYGGGSSYASLRNCLVAENSASDGGGSYNGSLYNCTVIGNNGSNYGGGASSANLYNCVIYFNSAPNNPNHEACNLAFCCTTPLPQEGIGNVTDDPLLASLSHLSAVSPCIKAGNSTYVKGTDFDGETWLASPSIGCDEFHPGSITGLVEVAISMAYSNVAAGFSVDFQSTINGRVSASCWNFGDGTVSSNHPYASHSWSTPGDYPVVLRAYNESYTTGVSATAIVHVVTMPVHYVVEGSTNPVAPYLTWETAAPNIQNAVDSSTVPGAMVLVTNGIYAAGGRAITAKMTNRVAVIKPVIVQSVNGPLVTAIQGYQVPSTTNGAAAVKCVYLADGAHLSGFTITGGATHSTGSELQEQYGGGIFCQSVNASISNCVLSFNSAGAYGGGVYLGRLQDCLLVSNQVANGGGGGACFSTLTNCTLDSNFGSGSGGGVVGGLLDHCVVSRNRASGAGGAASAEMYQCVLRGNRAVNYGGGGASSGFLNGCIVISNTAGSDGGGTSYTTLNSCLVVGNISPGLGGGSSYGAAYNCTFTANQAQAGGGVNGTALLNCISYFNAATVGDTNYYSGSVFSNCCTIPWPTNSISTITNEPLFLSVGSGDYRLNSNSPCINSGNNSHAITTQDLEAHSRIRGGTVDIGAYEFQSPASLLSYAWLLQYGFPVDGSVDFLDLDGDGMNTWQEWRAGTDPTDALSALRASLSKSVSAVTIDWLGVSGKSYSVERSTDLSASPFGILKSNIFGLGGVLTFTDTNALGGGPFFYRVRAQ